MWWWAEVSAGGTRSSGTVIFAMRARHSARRPGRAAGERLCRQRGRLAPQAPALRASHSRAWPPHYDRGRHPSARSCRCPRPSWPFLDRCQSAVGAAAGPGGAPAAKRGRTTWRRRKTTATLGREEGHRSRIAGKTTAPEGHLIGPRARPTEPLDTQRGIRSGRDTWSEQPRPFRRRTGRYGVAAAVGRRAKAGRGERKTVRSTC